MNKYTIASMLMTVALIVGYIFVPQPAGYVAFSNFDKRQVSPLCKNMELNGCGVTLTNCEGGAIYACLTTVIVIRVQNQE